MRKKDLFFILGVIAFFIPFVLFSDLLSFYKDFNHSNPMVTSFIKFALLATLGEVIGLRIKTGVYYQKGFGIMPRAIVWGIIGLTIKMAFVIFYTGTPIFLEKTLGLEGAIKYIQGPLSFNKLLIAFSISAAMNLIYGPIMMTMHKITDIHIINNGGTLRGFFKPLKFTEIFTNLNWKVQYNFVFKKTIPFFWIPAHTITFLLPVDMQVLFAAILGIMLGVILAIASQMSK
ncbi:MAG: hypothetical protein U9R32_11195 [Bacteroidota bacterium]|nr:hypothetical protein [Bacteroidota bacterium]